MKLFEFYQPLLEYKRNVTIQKMGNKLEAHAKSFDQPDKDMSADDILKILELAMDPTPNKKYMMWLIKQYLSKQFRLEDAGRVKTLLATYTKAKPRLPAEQKDINRFSFHQLDELVDSWSDRVDADTNFSTDNVEVLYNGPYGFLGIPETEEAACELGRGTKWCTAAASNNMFDYYRADGNLYVWIEKPGNKKYQLHFQSLQFMDARDVSVDPETLSNWRNKHPVLRKVFKEYEDDLIAYEMIDEIIKYVQVVIEGRWPEAEPVIMKHPESAYQYANEVIKGRWPEAEPVIMKEPKWAYWYARFIIEDRWPEAEPVIMKDPGLAYHYAKDVIKGRWPEAEPDIMKDPGVAYYYAKFVIKDRWPEAEPVIITDPTWSIEYKNVFDL